MIIEKEMIEKNVLTSFAQSSTSTQDMKSMSWEQYLKHRAMLPQPREVEVVQASPLPESNVVEVNMNHEDEQMNVWILPALPSFIGGSKQVYATGNKLLMVRMSPIDRNLYKSLFDRVMAGQSCVIFGHEGTGKSSGLNVVHVMLMKELLRPGTTLKEVAHRVFGRIYLYSLNKRTGKVECTGSENGMTLIDVDSFCRLRGRMAIGPTETTTVLLLELDENESDPQNHGVPTIVSVSTRGGDTTVKTMSKGGARSFVQSPPSAAEVHMLAKALYCVDKETALASADLAPNTSEEAFLKTIDERVLNIGGVVRSTLNGSLYAEFCSLRDSHVSAINSAVVQMSTRVNAEIAKYFFAPYAIDHCDQAIKRCEIKFLSDNAAALVSEKSMLNDEDIQTMIRVGLDHQCAVAVMLKYGLRAHSHGVNIQSPLPEGLDRDQWELYNDPGFTHRPTDTHRRREGLLTSFSDLFPGRTNPDLRLFHSEYLCKDIGELPTNTVWRSTVSSSPVGECFSVHLDARTNQKFVTFFGCISKRDKEDPISISVLRNWFQNLGLFKKENLGVKVRIVMFSDWHQETEYGLKFIATTEDLAGAGDGFLVEKKEKAGKKDVHPANNPAEVLNGEMEMSGLITHFPDIGSRLETFIVRAGIHLKAAGSIRRDVPPHGAPNTKGAARNKTASKKEK